MQTPENGTINYQFHNIVEMAIQNACTTDNGRCTSNEYSGAFPLR